MASKSLGTLTVDLIAKVGGFVEGMDKAERAANKRAQDIDKALAKMAKGAEKHLNAAAKAVGAIGVAAVAGGAAIVKGVADSAREIENLSRVANSNASQFQRWSVGAKTVGIEQQKLADILKDMSDRVGDFLSTGGGPMADFFENVAPQIGVTAQQFRKLSGPDALQLYVSSLEKANLSQNEMAFYMEAVASDATALLPLLKNNGAEIERLGDRAEELGAILSDLDVAQLAEVSKEMDELGLVVEGLGNKIAVAALPHVRELSELLQDPKTIAGIQSIAVGILDIASAAARGAAEVANFSRWLGESIAAANAGIAADDIARLGQEADKIRSLLDNWNPLKRTVLFGTGGVVEYWSEDELRAELKKIEGAIADAQARMVADAQAKWKEASLSKLLVPPDLIERTATLGRAYGRTGREIAAAAKKAADAETAFIKEVERGAKEMAKQREEADKLAEARDKAFGDVAVSVDALQRELTALKMGEQAHQAVVRELAIEAGMRAALSSGITANDADYRQLLATQYDLIQALQEEQAAQDEVKEAARQAAEESARVWEEAGNRIDEAFADAWSGAFDSFKDFGARIKEALLDLLGELAHMAITRPILVSLGITGSGSALAGGGGGSLGNLSNLTSLKNLLSSNPLQSLGAGLKDWGLTSLGNNVGNLSVMDLGLSALAGYAGNFLGGEIGKALFGKEAESSIAATIGGIGGTLVGGPLGSLIGSTIGSLLDSAFGGDGKERYALGVNTDPTVGMLANAEQVTGASGITLTSYAKRVGEEGWEVANTLLQVFEATDAVLLSTLTALGVDNIDLTGDSLVGKAHQAGKNGGSFFGSAEFNGIDEGDVQSAASDFVRAWLDKVREETGTQIDLQPLFDLARDGELLADTLIRVNAEFVGVNATLEALGLQAYDVSVAGMALAAGLAEAFGGMENLAAATSYYYDNFYTEQEKLAQITEQVNGVFAALNLEIPATRDEFRALVDGLDLTTAAGQNTFAALLNVAPAFGQVADAAQAAAAAAEQLAAAQEEQARQAIAARNATLTDIAGTILQRYEDREATLADLQAQLVGLDEDIADAQATIADAASPVAETVHEITRSVDALTVSSSQLRSMADNLLAVANSLRLGNLSPLTNFARLQEAQRQYEAAQQAARGGDASDLAGAAQSYLQQAAAYYASSPAYVQIFDAVTGNLEDMGIQLSQQADAAERAERAQEAQQAALTAISSASAETRDLTKLYTELDTLMQERQLVEQQIANLTATDSLDVMASQLERLTAITDGITSMTELLAVLPAALADQIAAALDIAITDYRALTPTEQFVADTPGFAAGGSHTGGWRLVGESGPELEYTGPSQIISNRDSRALFDSTPIVTELRAINSELAALRSDQRSADSKAAQQRQVQIRIGERTVSKIGREQVKVL